MQSGLDNLTKQRMLQARALSQEARGGESTDRMLEHRWHVHFRHRLSCVDLFIPPDSKWEEQSEASVSLETSKHSNTLKSQGWLYLVEILQTFKQQRRSQLRRLFPTAEGFETESRKFSKMWLPPLNSFSWTDQRQLLEGWHMPRPLPTLIMLE